MKNLTFLSLALILSISAFSQKPKPYLIAKFAMMKYEKLDVQPALFGSFGIKWPYFALGIGTGVTAVAANAYTPMYFEASYLGSGEKRVSPYVNFQVGTGIYNKVVDTEFSQSKTTGGLYLNPSVGVMIFLNNKKSAVIVSGSYLSSTFSNEVKPRVRGGSYSPKTDYKSTGFAVNVGFKF